MKNIIAILTAVCYCLLCSCYTKNQAIKKFCNQDTIQFSTIIHDTIIIDSIQVDTIFNESVDSVFITKNKIEIRYLKRFGKVYLEGKCKADTIYYEKKVMFEVPCTTPKLAWYKQLAADYWFILPLVLVLLVLLSFIRKWLNNQ